MREGLDFWKDGVSVFNPQDCQMINSFQKEIEEISYDLHASDLSANTQKVSYCIAGYAAHRIQKILNVTNILRKCWQKAPQVSTSVTSINFLGGGLKHPSESLADFVGDGSIALFCCTAHLELLANFPTALVVEVLHWRFLTLTKTTAISPAKPTRSQPKKLCQQL